MVVMVASALPMTDDQRVALARMASSSRLPHRQVVQARALLWAADGVANEEIARRSQVDSDAVRRWRGRFTDCGIAGVGVIAKGRGRKSWLPTGTVERVLAATGQDTPPGGATHWTTRSMAAHVGIGKDAVARIWADHGLKPWQINTFKISNDPRFEEKLVDVVGLYLNPPARAVVFSFDEKTQCQALDRTQPSLPMTRGRAATMTHDYKRHGTIDLFAAMNIGTGEVLTHLRKGHAGTDVLAFFKQIDTAVPRELDVHVVLDNLSAHTAPAVREWLAHPRRRRWHLHFTPTSSSWLNLIEH
jgi:transposase